MVKTTIRDAIVSDVPEITKLYIASVHTHFKGTLPDEELAMWTFENESRGFMNQISEQLMKIRVLKINFGAIIGFTRFGADADEPEVGNIESLFIKDIYHNQGYGTLMFKDAQDRLKEIGYTRMVVWTPTKGSAHNFYTKHGGQKCGQKINEIQFDLTAYSWMLTKRSSRPGG